MNIPNKSTCGGLKIFHEGNHNNEGNPHPQYVVDEVYYVPSDSNSNEKWAKILETFVNNNTCNTFTYLVQSTGATNAVKLNTLLYIDFTVNNNGNVNVNVDVDEYNFNRSNIAYKVEDGKIKLYIKSNIPYTSLQLRKLTCKLESGTTYIDEPKYEVLEGLTIFKSKICGLSIDRPENVPIGYMYYDLNQGKPIWWNGTNWHLSTGINV